MTLPYLPRKALDGNGNPVVGAQLFTYQTGTTNPLSVYSDSALTTALSNPIVSDANGDFPYFFGVKDQAYRLVLQDASGNTLDTEDGVLAYELVDNSTATRVGQIASTPLDFGAAGDGVTDDSSAVQSAITSAVGVVDLLGKVYKCNSQIVLKSGVTLKNGTLDFSSCTDAVYVVAEGLVAANVANSSFLAQGTFQITASSTDGISVGDLVGVEGSNGYGSGTYGELHRVEAIAGATVEFERKAISTAVFGFIRKYTSIDRVRIEHVRFICTAGDTAISIRYAKDCIVEHCQFEQMGASSQGILVGASSNTHVENCVFSRSQGTVCEAIEVTDGSRGTVIRNIDLGRDYRIQIGEASSYNMLVLETLIEHVRSDSSSTAANAELLIEESVHDIALRAVHVPYMNVSGTELSTRGCSAESLTQAIGHSSGLENHTILEDCEFSTCRIGAGDASRIDSITVSGLRSSGGGDGSSSALHFEAQDVYLSRVNCAGANDGAGLPAVTCVASNGVHIDECQVDNQSQTNSNGFLITALFAFIDRLRVINNIFDAIEFTGSELHISHSRVEADSGEVIVANNDGSNDLDVHVSNTTVRTNAASTPDGISVGPGGQGGSTVIAGCDIRNTNAAVGSDGILIGGTAYDAVIVNGCRIDNYTNGARISGTVTDSKADGNIVTNFTTDFSGFTSETDTLN